MSSQERPDCRAIFRDSRLHLVVWDRSDRTSHATGLRFAKALLEMPSLAGLVMPLLRPAGRSCANAADIRQQAQEWQGARSPWSCELWVQVAASRECEAWTAVSQEIKGAWNAEAGRCLGDLSYARWQPFGNSPSDAYVVNSGPVPSSPDRGIYDSLACAYRSALLKLIWWQGTAALAGGCVQSHGTQEFDPCADRDAMADLLGRMLQRLRLADFGLGSGKEEVHPSRFGASHMSCFALNAFLTGGADMDTAYGDRARRATQPHLCRDLAHYLAGIRQGRW